MGSVIWTYKSVVALFLIVEGRNKELGNILEGFLFIFHLSFTLKKKQRFWFIQKREKLPESVVAYSYKNTWKKNLCVVESASSKLHKRDHQILLFAASET